MCTHAHGDLVSLLRKETIVTWTVAVSGCGWVFQTEVVKEFYVQMQLTFVNVTWCLLLIYQLNVIM